MTDLCKCGLPWEPDGDQFGCWSCGYERNKIEDRRIKGYVAGLGWCWIEDGEIVEIIADNEESK